MVPLQMGIPGGLELIIVLLIALVLFGLPILLLGVGGFLYLRSRTDDETAERVAELEAEIDDLERELDAERADEERAASDGTADGTGDNTQTGA
jgi:sec-independent protein translocase protein TatA